MGAEHTSAIFLAELILLLFVGRILGEAMSRVGQPAIFGQLLAGVLLGPSLFGALLPSVRHVIFPDTPALKTMIDAVSQLGILLLLLLTGMDTDLGLVKRRFRTVLSTSITGIAVPFVAGVLLAYQLPREIIPGQQGPLVSALFLGTALSVSSVKIVAMVLMEVGATRRDLGQLLLATAVLDDTLAWILIAVIAGIAAHGAVDLTAVLGSLAGTALFLALCLTVGRRLVARIIRWANDNLISEVPVITAILVVMFALALTTDLIGVHTALGAFVAGLLIGQSPILTDHIEAELRGFIIAFFSPVFFAVAGLGMDVRTLLDPKLLGVTVVVILVASGGKFLGAMLGGRFGGLSRAESLALATGLNARGSTEVIVASIGLSMGALSTELYTMIVAMAIVTTMAMPPTLRWMLARVPLRDVEAKRLAKEDAEAGDTVPKMERVLAYVDDSDNGVMAAELAGIFAVQRQILVTIMDRSMPHAKGDQRGPGGRQLEAAATATQLKVAAVAVQQPGTELPMALNELVQMKSIEGETSVEAEASKGYSIVFAGLDRPLSDIGHRFEDSLQGVIERFDGPLALVFNAEHAVASDTASLDILVPTGGSTGARIALEVAIALAKARNGSLTVLHVVSKRNSSGTRAGREREHGTSILSDARQLGKRSEVPVKALTMNNSTLEAAIMRVMRSGKFGLVVIGSSFRRGDAKFLGPNSASLITAITVPTLLVAQ